MATPPTPFGIPNSVLPGNFYEDPTRFNSTIGSIGRNVLYRKSHICPCGAVTGSPDPQCLQCSGYGRYWDAPDTTEYICTISFAYRHDPGVNSQATQGSIQDGTPVLTVPSTATDMWANMSIYDQIVLPDSIVRYTTNLLNQQNNVIPYSYQVTVAATGAVNSYNETTHTIFPVTDYVVTVTKGVTSVNSASQPVGAPLAVEYTAAQAYVAYEVGAFPHIRPDVQGLQMPRRFHLVTCDEFMRGHSATS